MQIPHTALGDTVKVILMGLIPVQLRVDAWVAAVQIQLVRSDNALPDILVSGLRLSFRLPVVKQSQAVFGTALFLDMSIGAGNAAEGAQKSQRCCRQEGSSDNLHNNTASSECTGSLIRLAIAGKLRGVMSVTVSRIKPEEFQRWLQQPATQRLLALQAGWLRDRVAGLHGCHLLYCGIDP